MTLKAIPLKEALELEFNDYITWCYRYMNEAATRDPIIRDMWHGGHSPEMRVFLEGQWARRYWFHKNGVEA